MKCVYKVLCSLGLALGILIALMYVKNAMPADVANWEILAYGLIGFAVGGVVAMIVTKVCGGGSCGHKHH